MRKGRLRGRPFLLGVRSWGEDGIQFIGKMKMRFGMATGAPDMQAGLFCRFLDEGWVGLCGLMMHAQRAVSRVWRSDRAGIY